MTRQEILTEVKKYFDIDELVCDHTIKKFGAGAWQFLDTNLLHCLLIIRRDIVKKPMYCNSNFAHQKGLRCNLCQIVKEKKVTYLSGHVLGKALDLTSPSMKASEMRRLIKENADLFPCKLRLEKWDASGNEISWLHIDVLDAGESQPKIYEFRA